MRLFSCMTVIIQYVFLYVPLSNPALRLQGPNKRLLLLLLLLLLQKLFVTSTSFHVSRIEALSVMPSTFNFLATGNHSSNRISTQVSSQPSPGLLVRAVCAGRPRRRTTAPSFGQPPPTPSCQEYSSTCTAVVRSL